MLFLAIAATPVLAQQGSIRGEVTDAVTARPITGAQVFVPGTQRGALTNANGQYLILNVPVGTHTVRVENLGYRATEQTVTVAADQAAVANFQLAQAAIDLEQIVVTGTAGGTQKRALGNSVSQISAPAVTDVAPIHSVNELLQARTPGLTIMSNSGLAGTASKIRIRGASSLEAGNEPVFYIDGVRMTSGQLDGFGTGNSTVQHQNALASINPDDIESIEVIKGPAAATLYGAEASTGVIQIITKKGRPVDRGVEWTVSGEVGQEEWALDRVTTYWTCTEANTTSSSWPGCQGLEPGTVVVDHPLDRNIEAFNLENFGTRCQWVPDCVSANPLRTADVWNTNISARGGGDRYNFYVSAEKADDQGIFFNNFNRRTAGRANFGFVPSERLNFTANLGYTRGRQSMPLINNSSNSILRNAMRGRPPARPDWTPGYRNFSPELSNEWSDRVENERTIIGLTTNFQPFSWFSNRLTLGLDKLERTNTLFLKIDETGREPFGSPAATGSVDRALRDTHRWTLDYSGTATANLAEDYTSAFSAGVQLNARRFRLTEVEGEGLVANKLNLVGSAAVTTSDEEREEQTSLGFFFQEQLGWRDRLFATAAVRVDDNSAFGNDFSLVVYPKAQLAYVISDEPFFQRVPFVEDLKLRAAWGQAGNAPAPFSADRTFAADVTTVGDEATNFIEFDEFGNPKLKAETGQELELGFDASALDGRLGAEFTFYYQQTKDALIEVPAPPSTGFPGDQLLNVGEVRNSGIELLLHGSPIYTRNVVWDASISFATNSNELVSFGRDEDGNPLREQISFGSFAQVQKHKEGFPLGGYWSLDVERDASGNPILDANGDAIVRSDEEFVGPMLPTRELGLSNTLTLFGNLRLFATVDYKGGNYQWCAICSIRNRIDQNTKELHDPNTPPEEIARRKSLQTKEWIYPADFIKLRDVSATFTLPSDWTQQFRAQRLSLTLGARNLWMWTRYKGTSDPEQVFDGNAQFSQADYAGVPMTRRLSVALRAVF